MKLLKNIALGLFLAVTSMATTSVAYAYEEGRITVAPAEAIDNLNAKIKEAQNAITTGLEGKEVAAIMKEAIDLNKEINANDKVDIARQKANNHLKKARFAAKKDKMESASEHLEKAAKGFATLKSLL